MIGTYRGLYKIVVVCSILQTLFMLDIHSNGMRHLWLMFFQIPEMFLGGLSIVTIIVLGLIFEMKSENDPKKKDWTKKDKLKLPSTLGWLIYNVAITAMLAR